MFDAVEPVIRVVFEEFSGGKPVSPKFRHVRYDDAVQKYGTDKPDLRNPIEMKDVSEIFRSSGFQIFARLLDQGADRKVWAIPATGGGSRAFCDRMNSWAQGEGQPGMAYILYALENSVVVGRGPVANNLGPEKTEVLRAEFGLKDGDAGVFLRGKRRRFHQLFGRCANKIGNELGLVDKDRFELCWIVDFPMYGWDPEEKKIEFSHNPFSMPNLPVDEFLALTSGSR